MALNKGIFAIAGERLSDRIGTKRQITMAETNTLQEKIRTMIANLKRELSSLSVRASVIERYRRLIDGRRGLIDLDEDDEESELDEVASDIEALAYDLNSFRQQTLERVQHIEQGLRLVSLGLGGTAATEVMFSQYVLDEAMLCIRDVKSAKEGYDELIANVKVLVHDVNS